MKFVAVKSCEEEGRTRTLRRQTPTMGKAARISYGRACLWLILECGHCVQRMVPLSKRGEFKAPSKVRCSECA